ncbi:hypothetical protein MAR_031465 [Mya arenaria]|uniref:Uncharacterized protein n=1 Tax=Mya arenaria TaxID=6604 RepID=A0ABY7FC64_MYAAR|nr:hypothetical protein MAR_031465 [Mya arenaria]
MFAFIDRRWMILFHQVPYGQTVNAAYYSEKKRPNFNPCDLISHQDNAPANTTTSTQLFSKFTTKQPTIQSRLDVEIPMKKQAAISQFEISLATTPSECESCGCCFGRWNKCDLYDGKCNYRCLNGYWSDMCNKKCKHPNCKRCARYDGSDCLECKTGFYSTNCGHTCPEGCEGNDCEKEYGSCTSCIRGFYGEHCNISCPTSCRECDRDGLCSECNRGFTNAKKQCTCRTDICANSENCGSCTNTSYLAIKNECCMCNLENCASCAKLFDIINFKICKRGYFVHGNGYCKTCNSQCVDNKCNSASGRCLHGCITGYWNNTCDKECEPECLSCNQADGSCTQCKKNTTYGPKCRLECSTSCKHSMCDIDGHCTNGCISKRFGKQCENKCEEYCKRKDNTTLCSEITGMCLYGCVNGYRGRYCPKGEGQTQNTMIYIATIHFKMENVFGGL